MVGVQMAEEDLRQVLVGDHKRSDVTHRTRADVEDKLVTVTQFEQKTG